MDNINELHYTLSVEKKINNCFIYFKIVDVLPSRNFKSETEQRRARFTKISMHGRHTVEQQLYKSTTEEYRKLLFATITVQWG